MRAIGINFYKRCYVMSKPMRIQLNVSPVVARPHSVKVVMPNGKRGVVKGKDFWDSMARAKKLGAAFVIDKTNHKWKDNGQGGFISLGIVAEKVTNKVENINVDW